MPLGYHKLLKIAGLNLPQNNAKKPAKKGVTSTVRLALYKDLI